MTTNSDETFATKADIAKLEGKIEALQTDIKTLSGRMKIVAMLVIGLYIWCIGFALLFVDN